MYLYLSVIDLKYMNRDRKTAATIAGAPLLRFCLSLFLLMFVTIFGASPAVAQEASPGDACSVEGSLIMSGGPEITGSSYLMICDGVNWVGVMEYKDTGGVLFQNAYDSGTCTAAKDGRIRYVSSATPPWEFCDGTDWVNFKQPRCQDNDTGECYLDATRSNDDPEFIVANVKDGINILGVTGSLAGGGTCGYNESNLPPSDGSLTGCVSGQTISWGTVTDNGNNTVDIATPLAASIQILTNNNWHIAFCAELGLFGGKTIASTGGQCNGYLYDPDPASWLNYSAVCSFSCNCIRADTVECFVPQ